jgi:hypothetical protein
MSLQLSFLMRTTSLVIRSCHICATSWHQDSCRHEGFQPYHSTRYVGLILQEKSQVLDQEIPHANDPSLWLMSLHTFPFEDRQYLCCCEEQLTKLCGRPPLALSAPRERQAFGEVIMRSAEASLTAPIFFTKRYRSFNSTHHEHEVTSQLDEGESPARPWLNTADLVSSRCQLASAVSRHEILLVFFFRKQLINNVAREDWQDSAFSCHYM